MEHKHDAFCLSIANTKHLSIYVRHFNVSNVDIWSAVYAKIALSQHHKVVSIRLNAEIKGLNAR